MTLRALGAGLGVSEAEVSRWESGTRKPTEEHLVTLFALFRIDEGKQTVWRKTLGRRLPIAIVPHAIPEEDVLESATDFRNAIARCFSARLAHKLSIPTVLKRIERAIDSVWNAWSDARPDFPAPMRGPRHHRRMIGFLTRDFDAALQQLGQEGVELLMLGILIHDIGIPLAPAGCRPDELLLRYPEWSIDFLRAHQLKLGFSRNTVHVLEAICREHRAFGNLHAMDGSGAARSERAILALIRLADVFDVTPLRITGRPPLDTLDIDRPRLRDLDVGRVYRAVYGDWQRNLFLRSVSRNREYLIAELGDLPEFHERDIRTLQDNLRHDLQSLLDTVRDVLALDLNCLLVATQVNPPAAADVDSDEIRDLKRTLIGRLGTSRSPNARQVVEIVLNALWLRLKMPDGKAVFDFIENEFPARLESRAFQAPLRRLYDELKEIVESHDTRDGRLRRIAKVVKKYSTYATEALEKLAHHARPLLDPVTDVVVFGFSDCAHHTLACMPAEWKARVTVSVLEMRNKTVYRDDGSTEYADGIQYLLKLAESGFSQLRIASDISVAALLSEVLAGPGARPAVVIGVNAIHRPTGDALSTIGTQAVARIACSVGVPVYVTAENAKLTDERLKASRRRWNYWLTADSQQLAELNRTGVELYNPMEDHIPAQFIERYITEDGAWTPGEIGTRQARMGEHG